MTHSFKARTGDREYSFDDKWSIFNYVVQKLDEQGGRCYNGDSCMYRSDDAKTACAVGWLLPDEIYEKVDRFETLGGVGMLLKNKIVREHFFGPDGVVTLDGYEFLVRLQRLHDVGSNWEDGKIAASAQRHFVEFVLDGYNISAVEVSSLNNKYKD